MRGSGSPFDYLCQHLPPFFNRLLPFSAVSLGRAYPTEHDSFAIPVRKNRVTKL